MTGKELKQRLAEMGYSNINELAKALGENNQKLYASMSSPDVKTGLVESISKVLGVRVADFYPNDGTATTANDHSIAVNGSKNAVNTMSERFIGLLEKKDEQIDRMLGIIESLK